MAASERDSSRYLVRREVVLLGILVDENGLVLELTQLLLEALELSAQLSTCFNFSAQFIIAFARDTNPRMSLADTFVAPFHVRRGVEARRMSTFTCAHPYVCVRDAIGVVVSVLLVLGLLVKVVSLGGGRLRSWLALHTNLVFTFVTCSEYGIALAACVD